MARLIAWPSLATKRIIKLIRGTRTGNRCAHCHALGHQCDYCDRRCVEAYAGETDAMEWDKAVASVWDSNPDPE